MTRAGAHRLSWTLVWLSAALAALAFVRPWWLALVVQPPLLLVGGGLAEWAFRRRAGRAEIEADLSERARAGLWD